MKTTVEVLFGILQYYASSKKSFGNAMAKQIVEIGKIIFYGHELKSLQRVEKQWARFQDLCMTIDKDFPTLHLHVDFINSTVFEILHCWDVLTPNRMEITELNLHELFQIPNFDTNKQLSNFHDIPSLTIANLLSVLNGNVKQALFSAKINQILFRDHHAKVNSLILFQTSQIEDPQMRKMIVETFINFDLQNFVVQMRQLENSNNIKKKHIVSKITEIFCTTFFYITPTFQDFKSLSQLLRDHGFATDTGGDRKAFNKLRRAFAEPNQCPISTVDQYLQFLYQSSQGIDDQNLPDEISRLEQARTAKRKIKTKLRKQNSKIVQLKSSIEDTLEETSNLAITMFI